MFDTAIIGLGCAGYTAAIYTARYKLTTLLIGEEEGGMGMTAAEVGNWPGDILVPGPDLMERFKAHALSFENVTFKRTRVTEVKKSRDGFRFLLADGSEQEARTVVFATGSKKRSLGLPEEKRLLGKGVSYCATCDAFFYRGKDVAVIGGGDSAVEGAAIAARVAKTVYLIHRRPSFKAEPYWVDRLREQTNVVFALGKNITSISGTDRVTGVVLDAPFQGKNEIPVDGVFIEIGASPAVELPKALGCAVTDFGYLQVDPSMRTTVAGVYGAGDVTSGSNMFSQFATAAGEGAIAANSVFSDLSAPRTAPGAMEG